MSPHIAAQPSPESLPGVGHYVRRPSVQAADSRELLRLLLSSPPPTGSSATPGAAGSQPAAVRKTVLVVENEADVRLLFMTVLADAGFAVVAAADGREALTMCMRQDPDVIVLDLRMPVMDGADFVSAYRQLPAAGARIVAVSALSETETVAASLGCDAMLRKPVDIDDFVGTVVMLAAAPRPPVGR